MDNYENGIDSEEDRELFDKLILLWNEYKQKIVNVVNYEKIGQSQVAMDMLFGEVADIGSSLQDAFSALSEYNTYEGKTMSEANQKLVEDASLTMTFVVLFGLILAFALGLYISRIISRPVKAMVHAANSLALGDVNVDVKVNTRDEIGMTVYCFVRY